MNSNMYIWAVLEQENQTLSGGVSVSASCKNYYNRKKN